MEEERNGRCVACGAPATLPVRALEVRTLPVRGLGGESRVQALGKEVKAGVCESCAEKKLCLLLDAPRASRKQLTGFGAVLAVGVLLIAAAFLLAEGHRIAVMLGGAAVICGVLGIAEGIRTSGEKRRELQALSGQEALEAAAWEVFTDHAPKKEDVNDLTYIPMAGRALRDKNGDLMVRYHLLPEIAVEAWKRLHPEAGGQTGGDAPEASV